MDKSLNAFADTLARPEVNLSIIVACVLLFLTWIYLTWSRKLNVSSNSELKKKEEQELMKQAVMESSLSSGKEISDLLFDAQDVEMIKKVENLDMDDPTVVKHYVQQIRTQSYKNALSEDEQQREQEAKNRQLAQIFALMNKEKDIFGDTSMQDVQEQMSLYSK